MESTLPEAMITSTSVDGALSPGCHAQNSSRECSNWSRLNISSANEFCFPKKPIFMTTSLSSYLPRLDPGKPHILRSPRIKATKQLGARGEAHFQPNGARQVYWLRKSCCG